MRIGAPVALLMATLLAVPACRPGDFFRQYEYEEDIYLSLDGRATVYVSASVAALNALRGTSFETRAAARIDREAVRDAFSSPVTRVTRLPSLSRRRGRNFVHVRLEVDHVDRLGDAPPFAWATYDLSRDGERFVFSQRVGASAGKAVGDARWTGQELVAFRLHPPSAIVYHNAGAGNLRRGNTLVWEQPLADRMKGEFLDLEARMDAQSILSRTLLLFGAAFLAVLLTFGIILWRVSRHSPARRPRT